MSLFGSLYLGDSGLRTSQNALNTVAHNLPNLNTPGYVRQQVANSDTTYINNGRSVAKANLQVGTGAQYSECRHVRDSFMDAAYRQEYGRVSYYETSYSSIMEVQSILGELDGAAFKNSLSGLWTSMHELAKDPNNTVNMTMLMSRAASFVENASSVYKFFGEHQDNLNRQVQDAVTEINSIGQRIYELNEKILEIEAGGVENANDLRDERDSLLDSLSGFGGITYYEDEYSRTIVNFNGTAFVTDGTVYEMSLLTDKDTGFVTPYRKQNVFYKEDNTADYSSAYVFNLKEKISTAAATDVGSLRALLLARGDHAADYTDLSVDMANQRKLDKLGIDAAAYDDNAGLKYYNEFISKSVVMNAQAEFDNIVHTIVTKINEVLAENCDPKSGYLCNADGTPMQMFVNKSAPAYERVALTSAEADVLKAQGTKLYQIYDKDGNAVSNMYWKYIEEDAGIENSLYNITNLRINQDLLRSPSLLGFKQGEESVDFKIGEKLVQAFQNQGLYLNPAAGNKSTFENCYIDFVNQVATTGYVLQGMYEYEQLALETKDNERQTVIGVSSDEELEHMIMYQNAYNAASRYINVINSLLDALISMAA